MAVASRLWMIVSVAIVAADFTTKATWDSGQKAQIPPPLPDFSNLPMFLRSRNVSQAFRRLLYEELNVREFEKLIKSHKFTERPLTIEDELRQIVTKLDAKIGHAVGLLHSTCTALQNVYAKIPLDMKSFQAYSECCSMKPEYLESHKSYHTPVNFSTSCDMVPPVISAFSFYPNRNLTREFAKNQRLYRALKWQYFISSDSLRIEYPARNFDAKNYSRCMEMQRSFRKDLFINTVLPFPKHVVILIDHGQSVSDAQLKRAKTVAAGILNALSPLDEVAVIGIASAAAQYRQSCIPRNIPSFFPATDETKQRFGYFIQSLAVEKPNCSNPLLHRCTTNHSLGFSVAFDALAANFDENGAPMIMYISRGIVAIDEAGNVLRMIVERNAALQNRVLVQSFAVLEEGKQTMLEKTFLDDISRQNFTKYAKAVAAMNGMMFDHVPAAPKGELFIIDSDDEADLSLAQLRRALSHPDQTSNENEMKIHYSLPWWDLTDKGTVFSITKEVRNKLGTLGVMGLDLRIEEITDEFADFDPVNPMSYAFLIDLEGHTWYHPAFGRTQSWSNAPSFVDIERVELIDGFRSIRPLLLSKQNGSKLFTGAETPFDSQVPRKRVYAWSRLQNAPLIVAVVSMEPMRVDARPRDSAATDMSGIVYHRLDLMPQDDSCIYMKHLTSMENTGLYLSGNALQQRYIGPLKDKNEERWLAQGYFAYLTDMTRLIANPGFKEQIRNEVSLLIKGTPGWQKLAQNSKFSRYIVRRYAATADGVLLMYPASLIVGDYDPTSRGWFLGALQERDAYFHVSPPYLDPGQAGYLVTLSTVVRGERPGSSFAVVLAMDVTFGFMQKFLEQQLHPDPVAPWHRSFMFTGTGYVVAHPQPPVTVLPIENFHLTQMEPLVMLDLLGQPAKFRQNFVQKLSCNRYTDRTIQRHFVFNASFNEVIRNSTNAHGEQKCVKFEIVRVFNSSLFLGMVNQTCDRQGVCWCSRRDRWCLVCVSSDDTECECPCQCPMDGASGCNDEKSSDHSPAVCDQAEDIPTLAIPVEEYLMEHQPTACRPQHSCDKILTERDCAGVVGCEWCKFEDDGTSPLANPYCSPLHLCFGGILGRSPHPSAYRADDQEETLVSSTPVGPVAGGIMGVFVLLLVAVYCYRRKMAELVHRARESHFTAGTGNDSGCRLNPGGSEDDEEFHFDDGANNLVLASFERDNIHSISHLSSRPRPRRPPTESDHGYSTMTPNADDSEQATCIEPVTSGTRLRIPANRHTPSPNGKSDSIGDSSKPLLDGDEGCSSPEESPAKIRSNATIFANEKKCEENFDDFSASTEKKFLNGEEIPAVDFASASPPPPGQTVLPNQVVTTAQIHMVDAT